MSFIESLSAIELIILFLLACWGCKRLVEAFFPGFVETLVETLVEPFFPDPLQIAVSAFEELVKETVVKREAQSEREKTFSLASLDGALKQLLALFTVDDLKGVLQEGTKVRSLFVSIFEAVVDSKLHDKLISHKKYSVIIQVNTKGEALLPTFLYPFVSLRFLCLLCLLSPAFAVRSHPPHSFFQQVFAAFLLKYESTFFLDITNMDEAAALAALLKIPTSARWMIRQVFWPIRDKFAAAVTNSDVKDYFDSLLNHAIKSLNQLDRAKLPGKRNGHGLILNKLVRIDGAARTVNGMSGTVDGMAEQVNQIFQVLSSPDRAPQSTGSNNNN